MMDIFRRVLDGPVVLSEKKFLMLKVTLSFEVK